MDLGRAAMLSPTLVSLYLTAIATVAAGFFTLSRRFSRPTEAPRPPQLPAMAATVFGSQAGGKSVINYCYTDLPWKLMASDMYQFCRLAWAIPYVLLPMRPCGSGDLDELAWTRKNAFCVAVHVVLVVLQLLFLLSLPLALLLPVWTVGLGVLGFFVLNHVLCMLLNSRDIEFRSEPEYAPARPEHAREQWIFLNGVAVGEHWMQSNLNRLALTFKRPIRGIHNRTSGILFDIIECLVQRNFQYATSDVRMCYSLIKETLHDDRYDKVVFILHSQGGIEGGLVLDWLLQELPQELLSRLEVYTFGCAANHFNNPRRHVHSEAERRGMRERAAGTDVGPPLNGRAEGRPRRSRQPADIVPSAPAVAALAPALITETSSSRPSKISDRVIGHIEHYAHTFDFVALWGVLHFTSAAPKSRTMPRFIGRVFARASDRGGHQFNLHYLNGMFPLDRDESGALSGCAEANEFMDSDIVVGREGDESADVREAYERGWMGTALGRMANGSQDRRELDEVEVKVHGGSPVVSRKGTLDGGATVKVKDLSRLWQYRNGGIPDDKPRLHPDFDGVVRGATM